LRCCGCDLVKEMERLPRDLIGKIAAYLCDSCQDIISLSLTCHEIYLTIHSYSSPLWYDLYCSLVHQYSLIFNPNISWKESVFDIYHFISQKSPIHLLSNSIKTLIPRSGHSINYFDEKYVIQFGGATNNFEMTHSYDLFVVYSNHSIQILRSNERFRLPIASRWLHTGSTIGRQSHKKVIIFGGHGVSDLYGDVLLLELWYPHNDGDDSQGQGQGQGEIPTVTCSRPISSQSRAPSPRGGHSAIVYDTHHDGTNSSIYIFGGKVDLGRLLSAGDEDPLTSLSNELWEMDCSDCLTASHVIQWKEIRTTTGSPPCPRYCHSAVCHDNSMMVFGGWTYGPRHQNIFLNDLFLYHIVDQTWSEVLTCGIPPSPRCQTALLFWTSLVSGEYSLSSDLTAQARRGYLVVYGGAYHSLEVRAISICSSHLIFTCTGRGRADSIWVESH
jgi:hypothetical protein